MRLMSIAAICFFLTSCDTCGDEPCAGQLQATFELHGFAGPLDFFTCIGDQCGSSWLLYDSCSHSDNGATLPFAFELCAHPTEPGASSLAVTFVAGPPASTILDGETWSISVLSLDRELEATASIPAAFATREACGAECLSGSFDFGVLEAAPRSAEALR